MKLLTAVYRRIAHLVHEFAKFGVVGAVGRVVDLGAYNLLRYDLGGVGILHEKPLTARTISIVLATVVTYAGNRHWTWRTRERRKLHHEYVLFFLLNAIGLVINLAVLGGVTYVLQLTGPVWDNLANLGGIGLGTLFRFWSYRRFVFREKRVDAAAEPAAIAEPAEPAAASADERSFSATGRR